MMKGTETIIFFKRFVVGMGLLEYNEIIEHNVNVRVLSTFKKIFLSYKNKKF